MALSVLLFSLGFVVSVKCQVTQSIAGLLVNDVLETGGAILQKVANVADEETKGLMLELGGAVGIVG